MNSLEQVLEKRFPGYKAFITSRGSTALYLALRAIGRRDGYGEVIVPSTICPSVPLVVELAGFKPRFCDVEMDTFCMSPRTITPSISEGTKAILVVYLFGKSFDMTDILELSAPKGIRIVEDIAQGIGGEYDGQPLGSFGDFSILSFGMSKIIAATGGALLVRGAHLLKMIMDEYHELPRLDVLYLHELISSFRNLTTGFSDLMRSENICEPEDMTAKTKEKYRRLFVHKKDFSLMEKDVIENLLNSLDQERERRFHGYLSYTRYLDPGIKHVSFAPSDMCWRFPLLANNHNQQLEIIEQIRSNGGLISNHYFPSAFLFNDNTGESARQIGLRAINFCVDSSVTEKDIRSNCEILNRHFAHE